MATGPPLFKSVSTCQQNTIEDLACAGQRLDCRQLDQIRDFHVECRAPEILVNNES
ncbi:MAG: hypothetical protein MHPSP_004784, partial [Paramarteilia canceri]